MISHTSNVLFSILVTSVSLLIIGMDALLAILPAVSEVTPVDTSWVQTVVPLINAGGMGALLWYIIVRRDPRREEAHRKEREAWLQEYKSLAKETQEIMKECHDALQDHSHSVELLTKAVEKMTGGV